MSIENIAIVCLCLGGILTSMAFVIKVFSSSNNNNSQIQIGGGNTSIHSLNGVVAIKGNVKSITLNGKRIY